MLLPEWCIEEQSRVERFQIWWIEHNDTDFDNFPLNMEPGEWDEQYRMWEG